MIAAFPNGHSRAKREQIIPVGQGEILRDFLWEFHRE
jgi:hypothetical protein